MRPHPRLGLPHSVCWDPVACESGLGSRGMPLGSGMEGRAGGDPTDEATLPTAPLSSAQPLWVQDGSTSPATRNVAGGAEDAHEGLVAPWPHRPSQGPGDSGASFSRTPLGHRVTRGPGPYAGPQPPAVRQARGLRGPSSVLPAPQHQRRGVPQSHRECDPEARGDPSHRRLQLPSPLACPWEGPWETPSQVQAAGAAKVPRERRHWNVTLSPSLRG